MYHLELVVHVHHLQLLLNKFQHEHHLIEQMVYLSQQSLQHNSKLNKNYLNKNIKFAVFTLTVNSTSFGNVSRNALIQCLISSS